MRFFEIYFFPVINNANYFLMIWNTNYIKKIYREIVFKSKTVMFEEVIAQKYYNTDQ